MSHVSEKLQTVKEHENVEHNDSNESLSGENLSVMAQKYGIGPRPSSFSVHEFKVRINTRYAVSISCSANVAPK